MAAFREAIADGADWIELDVQETADGDVVVLHDSDFMKLAGSKLKIWDATIDDSKDIDIGSRFANEFNEERVPTRGVDGLLTDKPALARSVLEQRAEMSGPERLLLELAGMLGSAPKIVEQ